MWARAAACRARARRVLTTRRCVQRVKQSQNDIIMLIIIIIIIMEEKKDDDGDDECLMKYYCDDRSDAIPSKR